MPEPRPPAGGRKAVTARILRSLPLVARTSDGPTYRPAMYLSGGRSGEQRLTRGAPKRGRHEILTFGAYIP